MEQILFQDLDTIERIVTLESNADDIIEGYTYDRVLTDEEISDLETDFAALHIEMDRLVAEKKEWLEMKNAEIKAKQKAAAATMKMIRTRREEVTETVYVLSDEKSIGTYNHRGELVSSKPKRGGDRQYRMPLSNAVGL